MSRCFACSQENCGYRECTCCCHDVELASVSIEKDIILSKREIKFHVDEGTNSNYYKFFGERISNTIDVCDINKKLSKVLNPLEVVIEDNCFELKIDYPLFQSSIRIVITDRCFSRIDLLRAISNEYFEVYREEEEDDRNPGLIPGMLNRATTSGRHGIWGHQIEDLVIEGIYLSIRKNDVPLVTLCVGS